MKNKNLIAIIVVLLLIIVAFAIHMCIRENIMDRNFNDHNMIWNNHNFREQHDMFSWKHDWFMWDHSQWDHNMGDWNFRNNNVSSSMPVMPWQEAFGTIQEIINILDSDPKTDWESVSIDNLRKHLIDMNELTMYSSVKRENVTNGLKMTVTWTWRTLDAINSMVPSHKRMTLDNRKWWTTTIKNINNWVILTVTSNDKTEVNKIRGLGFIGIMAIWSQHPAHHLMMAKWDVSMTK